MSSTTANEFASAARRALDMAIVEAAQGDAVACKGWLEAVKSNVQAILFDTYLTKQRGE